MILDPERLSLSEYVNEKHIMMDTFVDIKTHLPREHWVEFFSDLFAMKVRSRNITLCERSNGSFGRRVGAEVGGLDSCESSAGYLRYLDFSISESIQARVFERRGLDDHNLENLYGFRCEERG